MAEVDDIRVAGKTMMDILGLSGSPVGVRFLADDAEIPGGAHRLEQHRYCQALMKARRGSDVLLTSEGISCPAAAAAFGFRPLPKGLESGQGLVGFGIVSDEAVGRKMFTGMPRLAPGTIAMLHLFPLDKAECSPDIVVVEDRLNFSYGCYGCRAATDIGNNESVLGFPASMLSLIVEHLRFLSTKAIPVSRSKRALSTLLEKNGGVRIRVVKGSRAGRP